MRFTDVDSARNLAILIIAFLLMFLPAVIATAKRHHNEPAITVLNLISVVPAIFFAASAATSPLLAAVAITATGLMPCVVGWCVALVWSFTRVHAEVVEARKQQPVRKAVGMKPVMVAALGLLALVGGHFYATKDVTPLDRTAELKTSISKLQAERADLVNKLPGRFPPK